MPEESTTQELQRSLVDFRELSTNPFTRCLLGAGQWVLDPLLKTRHLNRVHASFLETKVSQPRASFFDRGLGVLNIHYRTSEEDLSRIPKKGPVFMISNHPYGGIDGLILGSLMDRVREDGKLLVNFLLDRLDRMGGRCFYVDPFGGQGASRANLKGLKESLRWLKSGHMLATFPSGTVSHLKWGSRRVTDPCWAENLVPLLMKSGATVLPVYFTGGNSRFFQLAGLVHPALRTALLPREMLRSRNRVIEVRIGNPIPAKRLGRFESNRAAMDFLRLRTYILESREVAEKTVFMPDRRTARSGEPVAPAQAPEAIEEELAGLSPEALLVKHDPFMVYVARAGEVPRLLLELGRLREITFRKVGEGTGAASDLDSFDSTYRHLFIWNREAREVVGAYRLGLTDEIFPERGDQGLYTTTLFRFKSGVLRSLDPAIELGRSFVVEEYQRKPLSLGLLWRGIGQFIVRNPRYCTLFGPVSISKEYQGLSKNLMVAYLKENNLDPVLASKVKARHPLRSRNFGSLDRGSFRRSVRDIEDVSALISEIEREERGVPVLLRQYLKLNATLLSFNVDPAFNDSLDGLVLVDLRRTSEKTLRKYMGVNGAERFLALHRNGPVRGGDAGPSEPGNPGIRAKRSRE
ncbi:MAG: lysophospholipid acyltransferase family protein [Oceanipulchritudo sp.]